ncbi:hypothetical protein DU002_08585 [Corallincola holothuriorum]|uniref:Uncharacterized protein n=1 Tax=Corallincola holothuriorum TaxID=2282215 RepID=A0A368NM00_9GAMM|nr:hypothetical protein DU002_08585 [Corallincola holothuriorum]
MVLKTDPKVNEGVKDFSVELVKILFSRNRSITEKYHMVLLHIAENKVWACYLVALICVLLLLISSLF